MNARVIPAAVAVALSTSATLAADLVVVANPEDRWRAP
jgi:hypothetical protein